ncbi:MAG: phage tail tube protein [Nitrososphaerales archaeon]
MANYLRMGKESSYGVPAPSLNTHIRILSESLKFQPGVEYLRTVEGGRFITQVDLTKAKTTGSIEIYPVYDKGLGEFLYSALGEVSTTQPDPNGNPTVYRHTFTPRSGSSSPWPSYTIEVGLGSVAAKRITGCVVNRLIIEGEAGDHLGITADILGGEESRVNLYTGPFNFSQQGYIHTSQVVHQEINGIPVKFEHFSLELNNNFPEGYRFGSRFPQEVEEAPLDVKGSATIKFDSSTHLDRFLASEENSISLKFQGSVISGNYRYELEITLPRLIYEEGDVNLKGQDRLTQILTFTALKHSVNGVVKITLQNDQSGY